MSIHAKFVHTNLIAKDWRTLADFYEKVFGCTRILPERHLSGKWLEDATGVPDAEIHGIHLRLPGYGDTGPTLEIFQYNQHQDRSLKAVNQPGLAHIAFAVDDVGAARDAVIKAGGSVIGELTTVDVPNAGKITFIYLTDLEGNIIELQKWLP
jgi:predicted enzyme related to lactoylglutathione lyase